ncbi:MAG: AAA family ATPase, partial [Acidimicrobiia bacterium]
MEVLQLELTDFRNYERAELELASGVNAVVGRNGQGKTNLVEAVYLLSALGSHRVSTSAPMIRHETDRAVVAGTGPIRSRQTRVDVEIKRGAG